MSPGPPTDEEQAMETGMERGEKKTGGGGEGKSEESRRRRRGKKEVAMRANGRRKVKEEVR